MQHWLLLLLQLLLSATLQVTVDSSQLPVDSCQLTLDSNQQCWRLRIESEELTVDRWVDSVNCDLYTVWSFILLFRWQLSQTSWQFTVDSWQMTPDSVNCWQFQFYIISYYYYYYCYYCCCSWCGICISCHYHCKLFFIIYFTLFWSSNIYVTIYIWQLTMYILELPIFGFICMVINVLLLLFTLI